MESLDFDVEGFLMSKEIEIKEREANFLRIIMRCRKLGIDIPADIWNTEEELHVQENVTKRDGVESRAFKNIEKATCTQPGCDLDELVEPRLEDFGLSEERLMANLKLPINTMGNFKSLASLKPKQHRLESTDSTDGSPWLSIRTVPFDKTLARDPTFNFTPEVCQMSKMSQLQGDHRGKKYDNRPSPVFTPKLNVKDLYDQRFCPVGQRHFAKRQSLVSPEEPELTCTFSQFKTHAINENNNAFLANIPGPSAFSSNTPDEPEFVLTTKVEDISFSDLQMPQSPQLSLDY